MKTETWYTADEAVTAGLADGVVGTDNLADLDVGHLISLLRGDNVLLNSDFDSSAWDAAKAWAAGAASDDPAAFYNAICAGKRSGDAATQAGHALPHHYHPGDPPNRAGVDNALARLSQTQGLTNEAAAKSHLQAHARLWEAQDSFSPEVFLSLLKEAQ
jgi:enoyl-CoA hydratase/carnithine racemase